MKKKVALIKSGRFSHTNESVRLQLVKAFAEHELIVWDVRSLLGGRLSSLLQGMGGSFAAYGVRELIRRRDPVDCFIQNPASFALIRDEVRRRVDPSEFAFTFQTQSMWDASVPGVPHFVYTDNTELALFEQTGSRRSLALGSWWLGLEKEIYERADRVFTMSPNIRRSVVEQYGIPEEKVRCVFAGSNADIPSACADDTGRFSRKAILFVGKKWEAKGGPELLEAFQSVAPRHPEATLTIVGCRPRLRVRNCEVLGPLPLEQVAQLYETASLFCLPTRKEAFGIAFVEAMHHGLPLIGTNIGAVPGFIAPDENGVLVPVRDAAALAAALDRLLSDPEAMRRMGRRSLLMARDRYTWDRVGQRLREEIDCVTKR